MKNTFILQSPLPGSLNRRRQASFARKFSLFNAFVGSVEDVETIIRTAPSICQLLHHNAIILCLLLKMEMNKKCLWCLLLKKKNHEK